MISANEEQNNPLLGKKRNKDSNEKSIRLIKIGEDGNEIIENEKIESEEQFSEYLSSLKNPFALKEGRIIDLNTDSGKLLFYNDLDLTNIYEDKNDLDLLEDYKLLYEDFIKSDEKTVKVKYPISIENFFIAPQFFLDLPLLHFPKLYKWTRNIHNGVNLFFGTSEYKIFHLFSRKQCGTTFYLMKQMSRNPEYKIYLDLRKLNEILSSKKNKKEKLKKFVFYSLFYIHHFYENDIQIGYKRVKNYFNEIWKRIISKITSKNNIDFIIALLDSYVYIYRNYFISLFDLEKNARSKAMSLVIDHYEDNFELTKIYQIVKNNDKIKILVKHSINNKKDIEKLFNYIDNNNYQRQVFFSTEGIELAKDNILIGYYNEMIKFGEENFEDKEFEILKLYKEELINNFGLNNPNYYIRFLDFTKNTNSQLEKDPKIFKNYINIISKEIEYNISQFYYYDLSDENYFLSKYYKEFSNEQNDKNFDNIKKNIPLDIFILKYDKKENNIVDIKPSCTLINEIITKKSKIFDCIIYQSKYYENTTNMGERGNILQRAIEEKIQLEPSILLNYLEKTCIFKLEYIIPSSKVIDNKKYDPVEE